MEELASALSLSLYRQEKKSDFHKLEFIISQLMSNCNILERLGRFLLPITAPRFIMSGFGTFPSFNLERVFHSRETLERL